MKKFYLLFFLLVFLNLTAQTTETFEDETLDGVTTFSDNGQSFTITGMNGFNFTIQASYIGLGFGWNGSVSDQIFIDNSSSIFPTGGKKFSIKTSNNAIFTLKSLWLFLQTAGNSYNVSGSLTIEGFLNGSSVFTATTSSGYLTGPGTTNGFREINMTNFGNGSPNNSNTNINEFTITTIGNIDYIAMDAMRWQPLTGPTITTSATSLTGFTSCSGTPSVSPQSFTVTGSNLTGSINLSAVTGYEYSTTSGGTYTSTLTLPQAGGTVYVRLASGATGSPSGSITLSSSGATNKTVSLSGTVTTTPIPTVNPLPSSICAGATTTFSVTASNAANYKWQVSTGASYSDINDGGVYSGTTTPTLTITGATAGMNGYSYRARLINGSCTDNSIGATLTVNTAAAVTSNPPTRNVCTGANTTFTVAATGATAYQWQVSTDGGNIFNDIADGGIYSNTATTILDITGATSAVNGNRYRCRITGGCGTVNSNSAVLNVSTIVIGQSQTNVTTFGGGNGTATATASGGIGGYTYSWSPSGGAFATATGLSAGTYTVTVKDVLNCEVTASYVITQPAGVSTSLSTLTPFGTCSGTASADKTFNVNGGAGLTADVVVTAPAGYEVSTTSGSGYSGSVTITQSGGAIATTTIYVRMAASASGIMSGNVTVSSTGVTTKNVSVNGLASNLSASSYTVTNVSCFGGNNGSIDLTPSGGQPAYTYHWVGGASTQDRTSLTAGTYSVTITDGNGCTYTISNIVVGQPTAALSAATGGGKTDVSCFGGANGTATVVASGGSPSYSYSWNTTPAQSTATATGLIAGTYTVTVTDSNGCQATRTYSITQPPALNLAIGGGKTDVSCFGGANGTATVAPTGGTTSYTYTWDTTPVQTTATATGLTAGTYTVTVEDALGCQAFRTFTINQPASALTATQGTINNVSCFNGSNGSAQVIASGGTPSYTYSWSPSGGTGATASGLAAGTYTVTVTDNKGCIATQSFTINQPAAALSAATGGGKTDVSCNGGANGTATVAPTGGTPSYTYSWAPSGGTAATASGLVAGTYTVTVTDANGCQATRTFTINQPAAAVNAIPVMQTNIACRGAATGSATVTASGGTGAYTYSWAPSGGNAATASNLAAGTYTVTVTDANGCIDTQSFTITQPAAVLSTTAGIVSNVSCNGGANGSAQVIASGGTPGYSYSWAPSGGSNATANGLTDGTYTVTVTDANGCQATRSFTINQPSALVASQGIVNNVSCNGGTNGSATVNVTGGTPSYTYSWSPTGGNGVTASGLVAGTYTVTVTDANNCQATQSFTINQPTALISTISKTDVLCNGGATGTATVSPTGGNGGYTYVWSPSGGTAATATGLAVGNYSCLITDAQGCSITKNITINQPSALGATTSQTDATCAVGGTATVTPFGGTATYTYLWTPGGATTQSVSNLSAGLHSCKITDANGCTITRNFVIGTTNTLVASTFYTNLLCNGVNTGSAGVTPSGAPGPYTYVWTPSVSTSETATNLAAGNYSVLITASNGCSITKNFTITQPSALVASPSIQTNVSCNAGNNGSAAVTVTGGTGAYTYAWAPSGGTSATANGLAAGTYTVTVTDANFCQTTQTFTITQPAPLVATASAQTNVSCNGGINGSATVAVTGGTGAYTYVWAPSGGTAATASGLSIGIYTVTVTDANNCQTTQTFTITEPTVLSATNTHTNVLCNGGATGTATVTPTGGTLPYTYSWNTTPVQTTPTATGLNAGTYTCTITDNKGCTITSNVLITQPPLLVASAGTVNNLSCNGGSNGSAQVIASGGTVPYSYDWNGTPIGDGTPTISGLASGTYTVTVTDANGCTATQSFTITQPAALTATSSQTDVSCFGASNGSASVIVSGGTGAYSYSWNTTPVQTAATATGLSAGNYTVTITDANTCSITRNFTITGTSAFTITPTQTNVTCNGLTNGTATVTVTGGTGTYTYVWSPSGGTAATASGLAPGTYSVAITDGNGCTASQSFTITQPTALTVTGSSSNINCNGAANGMASAAATGGTAPYTYSWAPSGGTASSATGLSAGNYVCTVTDANGCTQTRSYIIYEQTPIVATSVKTNVLCHGVATGSATVSATGGVPGYTYAWSTGAGGPTVNNLVAGTYTCTVRCSWMFSSSHSSDYRAGSIYCNHYANQRKLFRKQ
ncbi:MAG: hypothetical protein DI539_11065 [Flavobacterium psychrophilum]|nr:MAG: hypothetical protein DI539_11065 [Flavobacterium psychrophilum]